jgi:hypothetical protein
MGAAVQAISLALDHLTGLEKTERRLLRREDPQRRLYNALQAETQTPT